MNDQDNIEALLASAGAGSSPAPETPASTAPQPSPSGRRVRAVRDNGDVLGLSWLHGVLHAAVFRRQKLLNEWACPAPIKTVEEFEPMLDVALEALGFGGTEVFLLLENELFSHQSENAPASPKAAQVYLERRVARLEKDDEPMLWVSQPAMPMRQEQSYVLHLLPKRFYDQLNRVLLARRLDLTRILPLVVPLQRELNRMPIGKDTPMLLVADVGETTALTVGRVGGPLLFFRTILTSLTAEPARVGVEVNRSVLYAKQQFGDNVEHIWILAANGKAASQVQAKAGAAKKIVVLPTSPGDWLQTAIKIPARQPVNLLGGYLRRKRRRALVRWSLLLGCWLGLAGIGYQQWQHSQVWAKEKARVLELQADQANLEQERERLQQRNTALAQDQRLVREVLEQRLPPVPGPFLNYLATLLPSGARLTGFTTAWDGDASRWTFRLEGSVEGDLETARQVVEYLETELARSPLRARFNDAKRAISRHHRGSVSGAESQRFVLEGGLLEN